MRFSELTDDVNQEIFRVGFEKSKPILGGKVVLMATPGMIPYHPTKKITSSDQFRITAKDKDGTQIGWVNFEMIGNELEAIDVVVDPSYRRQGIASEMYRFAKELSGSSLPPSGKLTKHGRAFRGGLDLTEGLAHPIICVDVQPEYAYYGNNEPVCRDIVRFVNKQTGPVLMFVNAEDQGMSGDTVTDIQMFWEDTIRGEDFNYEADEVPEDDVNWNRFTIVDKGFGYFRAWMDLEANESLIIRVIRAMYQAKINDSREFEDVGIELPELVGEEWQEWMKDDPLIINWTSVAQLRKFSGAYIVGGGKNECLREVELLMNAFNIKYKRIESLVY